MQRRRRCLFRQLHAESLIVLKNLSKKFGKKQAVNRISLSVQAGGIFGFLGANGAGKTTTIRMLCGLTKPTAGSGTIGDLNIWKDRLRIRSRFGYVPQKFSLYSDLTVGEKHSFFCRRLPGFRRQNKRKDAQGSLGYGPRTARIRKSRKLIQRLQTASCDLAR